MPVSDLPLPQEEGHRFIMVKSISKMPLAGGAFPLQRVVICALAGLLIFYHLFTLYDLYLGSGTDLYEVGGAGAHHLFEHVQSALRVMIVISLILVAMNRRLALYGMWAAIGALVATHYWAFFFDLPFRFLEGRHPLSFLKGFIIPTVITILFISANARGEARERAG